MVRLPAWTRNKRNLLPVFIGLAILAAAAFWACEQVRQYVLSAWDRNRVQAIISAELNRRVELGSIDWSVGFQGLWFATDRMSIADADNTPLLRVGKTEINFAVVSMLKGQLLPKRVKLESPEFWAKRLSQDTWNFSDLSAMPDLYNLLNVRMSHGKVHLIDRRKEADNAYRATEIEDLKFEVNRSWGKLFWPFSVSFDILQPNGKCAIKLSGIGNGSIDQWRKAHYTFGLNTSNLDPMRLTSFLPSFPEIHGLVDLELKGSGKPEEEFQGEAKIKANRVTIMPPGLGPIKVSDATSSAHIAFNKKRIVWQDLSMKLGEGEMRSEGKLENWLGAQPNYEAKLTGHFNDLGELLKHIDAEWVSTGLKSFPKNLSFEGTVSSSGTISAAPGKQIYTAAVSLTNGTVKLEQTPFVASAVNGVMNFDQNGLDVKSLKGRLDQGQFQVSGRLVPEKTVNLSLESKQVELEQIRALFQSLKLQSPLLNLPVRGSLEQANATVSGSSRNPDIAFVARPKKIIVEDKKREQAVSVEGGSIDYNKQRFKLDRVKGNIGRGGFEVSGQVGMAPRSAVDLTLAGRDLDLGKAKAALAIAKVDMRGLTDQPASGQLKTADVRLTGTSDRLNITLKAEPLDLLLEPGGPTRPIHLKDGNIAYEGDTLNLENVKFSTEKSNAILGMKLAGLNNTPLVKHLKLENLHADLGELSGYLAGKRNPDKVRKMFIDFEKQSGTYDWQGQVNGNFTADAVADGFKVQTDGTMQSIQFQRFGKAVNLASGSFSTGKNGETCLKDVNGSVGRTTFVANGCLKNFGRTSLGFSQLHVDSKVVPQDLTAVLFQEVPKTQFKSSKPIKATLLLTSEGEVTHADFSADVEPDTWSMVKFGDTKFKKPKHQKFSVSGTASLTGNKITFATSKVLVGTLPIQFAGTINQAANSIPEADLKFWIHDPIPIASVAPLAVGPLADVIRDAGPGQVDGGMRVKGPMESPQVRGRWHILACSLPKLGLTDASGIMRVGTVEESGYKQAEIELKIDSAHLQSLAITGLEAHAVMTDHAGQSTLRYDKITGKVAKGTFTADGSLDLFGNQHFKLNADLKGLDTREVFANPKSKKDDVTGSADFTLSIEGALQPENDRIKSLTGSGEFSVKDGRIAKLSQLQVKIEQGNLLESGILGFNMANVLSAINPGESGEFLTTGGHFNVNDGIIRVEDFTFNGEGMQLKSSGQVDLIHRRLKLQTVGGIPRVVAQGTVSKAASLISLGGIVDFVALPFSGSSTADEEGLASRSLRPFAFDVDISLDHPETLDQSIRKSFRWISAEKLRQATMK